MSTGADRAGPRLRAWRHGRRAETICAWWLRLRGYRIVASRYRCPVGEIDLIARRGRILAFVEVKARDEDAAEALRPRQRRRIVRAAEAFLQRRPALARLDPRFDLIVLRRRRLPRHVPGAWRADDG
ncbi:MAG: YraN family protein [Rhodospirillales bacterium]|nr:YraN family protein [Rhodospirillales bacterium]